MKRPQKQKRKKLEELEREEGEVTKETERS